MRKLTPYAIHKATNTLVAAPLLPTEMPASDDLCCTVCNGDLRPVFIPEFGMGLFMHTSPFSMCSSSQLEFQDTSLLALSNEGRSVAQLIGDISGGVNAFKLFGVVKENCVAAMAAMDGIRNIKDIETDLISLGALTSTRSRSVYFLSEHGQFLTGRMTLAQALHASRSFLGLEAQKKGPRAVYAQMLLDYYASQYVTLVRFRTNTDSQLAYKFILLSGDNLKEIQRRIRTELAQDIFEVEILGNLPYPLAAYCRYRFMESALTGIAEDVFSVSPSRERQLRIEIQNQQYDPELSTLKPTG